MTTYISKSTDELRQGDVVLNHGGMRILIDSEIRQWTGHRGSWDTDLCYGTVGSVINAAEVRARAAAGDDIAQFVVGHMTRDDRKNCWYIQGNHLATWSVEVPTPPLSHLRAGI